jgi:hypothetical protein
VFVAGSALAGLGGVMWGLYQQSVTPQIGAQVNVLIFIVIIIGGLGSHAGLLHRRAAGGADGQLHRLPGAQGGAVLQHRADGGGPAVAAAGPVPGDEPLKPKAVPIRIDTMVGTIAAVGVMSLPSRIRPATQAKP